MAKKRKVEQVKRVERVEKPVEVWTRPKMVKTDELQAVVRLAPAIRIKLQQHLRKKAVGEVFKGIVWHMQFPGEPVDQAVDAFIAGRVSGPGPNFSGLATAFAKADDNLLDISLDNEVNDLLHKNYKDLPPEPLPPPITPKNRPPYWVEYQWVADPKLWSIAAKAYLDAKPQFYWRELYLKMVPEKSVEDVIDFLECNAHKDYTQLTDSEKRLAGMIAKAHRNWIKANFPD
jgi:hypothetical protein